MLPPKSGPKKAPASNSYRNCRLQKWPSLDRGAYRAVGPDLWLRLAYGGFYRALVRVGYHAGEHGAAPVWQHWMRTLARILLSPWLCPS
jgi:hypothetical protein